MRRSQFVLVPILLLVVSCSEDIKYDWPPDRTANPLIIDSLNAAYNYERAEELFAWDDCKSSIEMLQKIDSLYNLPHPKLIHETSLWIHENESAIQAMLEGADKQYCDFTFGDPKPFPEPGDRNRIYPELLNLLDLALISAWHFDQTNEADSAMYMLSSAFNVLAHLDNQVNSILISKLVEIIALNHVSRVLMYSMESTYDTISLNRMYLLGKKYIHERNNLDNALTEQLFMRIDFEGMAKKQIEDRFDERYADSEKQILDSLGLGFEEIANEVAEHAKQSYLKGMYKLYDSYSEAFTKNDPSVIHFEDNWRFNLRLYWLGLNMGVKLLFLDSENPEFPEAQMGRFIGKTLYSTDQRDYSEYIESNYLIEAELRIVLRAIEIKLSKLTGAIITSDIGIDPFNSFRQLKEIRQEDKFIVYSFGPDRKDGRAHNLDVNRMFDQDWSGRDLGLEFGW